MLQNICLRLTGFGRPLLFLALAMSCVSFLLYGVDKHNAIRHSHRIPERELLAASWFFGAWGALLAMYVFHHKTRKPKFRYGVALAAVLQLVLMVICHFGNRIATIF